MELTGERKGSVFLSRILRNVMNSKTLIFIAVCTHSISSIYQARSCAEGNTQMQEIGAPQENGSAIG
eukprot:scaffold10390_cov94-Skeletonema_dohrnii-CCMP3373.AAC.1